MGCSSAMLPLEPGQRPGLHALAPGSGTAPGDHSARADKTARRRLLVVEDEWIAAALIEAILSDAGYVVVGTASDGDEALRLARETRPDLVLMDILLRGGSDGVAAATAIHDRLGIRCIYVTAHSDAGTLIRGSAARPVGWVHKPFTEQSLLHAVRRAFEDAS